MIIMLYNIKVVHLYCVFHGIRFKVNEDWVSVIDTLLFFYIFSLAFHFFCSNKRNETKKIRRLHFFVYSNTFFH